jgi:hypothetical protein
VACEEEQGGECVRAYTRCAKWRALRALVFREGNCARAPAHHRTAFLASSSRGSRQRRAGLTRPLLPVSRPTPGHTAPHPWSYDNAAGNATLGSQTSPPFDRKSDGAPGRVKRVKDRDTPRDPGKGVSMDKDSPEAWGVAYVSDSGKALTLDKLFLCKNCEPIEDHVRVSFKSFSSFSLRSSHALVCKNCEPIVDHVVTAVSYSALDNGD